MTDETPLPLIQCVDAALRAILPASDDVGAYYTNQAERARAWGAVLQVLHDKGADFRILAAAESRLESARHVGD